MDSQFESIFIIYYYQYQFASTRKQIFLKTDLSITIEQFARNKQN